MLAKVIFKIVGATMRENRYLLPNRLSIRISSSDWTGISENVIHLFPSDSSHRGHIEIEIENQACATQIFHDS